MTDLRARHSRLDDTEARQWGVNGETGKLANMKDSFVWDCLSVKQQVYKAAVEAVSNAARTAPFAFVPREAWLWRSVCPLPGCMYTLRAFPAGCRSSPHRRRSVGSPQGRSSRPRGRSSRRRRRRSGDLRRRARWVRKWMKWMGCRQQAGAARFRPAPRKPLSETWFIDSRRWSCQWLCVSTPGRGFDSSLPRPSQQCATKPRRRPFKSDRKTHRQV